MDKNETQAKDQPLVFVVFVISDIIFRVIIFEYIRNLLSHIPEGKRNNIYSISGHVIDV